MMLLPALIVAAALPAIFPFPAKYEPQEGYCPSSMLLELDTKLSGVDRKRLDDAANEAFQELKGRLAGSHARAYLALDRKVLGEEAYKMDVTPAGVRIAASSPKGLYWGLQTLHQMKTADGFQCAHIEDAPKFTWRGVLLDVGRHYMEPAFIKHFLDVMSLYKFNVLHWHLTEDQGWRIEIKSHPELTKTGAWRKEGDGTYGGFYTQDDVRDIVDYATARNITVVPEIEMPGHSSAAIASDPDLGCTKKQIDVPATWGVFQDVYCAGRESTFKFLDDVLSEVVALFPGEYIHIGGDEVPKNRWQACPDCQARIQSEHLKDEHELQSYFIRRIQKMLAAKGKKIVGWDEIMQGGLAKGAVVEVWNDQALAKKALDQGNSIVLAPASNCYLNTPPDRLTMEKVYSYDPLQGIDRPEGINGLETTLWSEHITPRNCLEMFLPRGLAMSEIFWSNPPKDFESFRDRVRKHQEFMKENGIDFGPEGEAIVSYKLEGDSGKGTCTLRAKLGLPEMELRYTLDGTEPTASSASSDGVIEWPVGKTLRVAPFKNGQRLLDPVTYASQTHLAYGKQVQFLTQPSEKYNAAGPRGLVDGFLGSSDFHDGIWLGWDGIDLVATVDLGEAKDLHQIALHCMQDMGSWILMPRTVRYEVSEDGRYWHPFGEARNTVPDTMVPSVIQWFSVTSQAKARYIKVTAENYGKLPAWHNGAGGMAWVFADELRVN